jgi:hypothetical protein
MKTISLLLSSRISSKMLLLLKLYSRLLNLYPLLHIVLRKIRRTLRIKKVLLRALSPSILLIKSVVRLKMSSSRPSSSYLRYQPSSQLFKNWVRPQAQARKVLILHRSLSAERLTSPHSPQYSRLFQHSALSSQYCSSSPQQQIHPRA